MTGQFSVLYADDVSQRKMWMDMWSAWPGREVMAHPTYVDLFAKGRDRSACAVWTGSRAPVMFDGASYKDLITPYGYGGAFTCGERVTNGDSFWDAFDDWCAGENIVSVFARLSLFEEFLLLFRGETPVASHNVVRTLELDEESMWGSYNRKVRKNVVRARESGLTVAREDSGARLDEFFDIYNQTMTRSGAAERYLFPLSFFETIATDLQGSYQFFYALLGEQAVSAELVLTSADHIYSFLGGTLADYFPHRPNDLLKHEIIRWGSQAGKQAFVMGGGQGGDDGIYRYKLAFAPEGSREFRTGCRIMDEAAVAKLVAARQSFEQGRGVEWNATPGFFPPYRA